MKYIYASEYSVYDLADLFVDYMTHGEYDSAATIVAEMRTRIAEAQFPESSSEGN